VVAEAVELTSVVAEVLVVLSNQLLLLRLLQQFQFLWARVVLEQLIQTLFSPQAQQVVIRFSDPLLLL
jgi:hypothetical protein